MRQHPDMVQEIPFARNHSQNPAAALVVHTEVFIKVLHHEDTPSYPYTTQESMLQHSQFHIRKAPMQKDYNMTLTLFHFELKWS